MFCSQCGKEIEDTAAFCRYCGAKVTTTSESEPEREEQKENVTKMTVADPERFSAIKELYATDEKQSDDIVVPPRRTDQKMFQIYAGIIAGILAGIIAGFCTYHFSWFGCNKDLSNVVGEKLSIVRFMHPIIKAEKNRYYIGNYVISVNDDNIVQYIGTDSEMSEGEDSSHNIYGAYIGQSKNQAKQCLETEGLTAITDSDYINDTVWIHIGGYDFSVYSIDCYALSDEVNRKKVDSLEKEQNEASDDSSTDSATSDASNNSNSTDSSYDIYNGYSDATSEEDDTSDSTYDDSDEDYYDDTSDDSDEDLYDDDTTDDYDADYYDEDYDEETDSDLYILPNSNSEKLTKADLQGLSKEELRIARNEIYARHGRRFQDEELQEYFDEQDWYDGYIEPEDFIDSVELTVLERRNAKFIKKFE